MTMHEGHRQRLKERFRLEGLDNFNEVQVLELLLFYCIPRVDTNPLAHRLLERFGSLAQVLEAPAAELERVEGMGRNASTFLSLTTAVGRYYLVNRTAQNTILDTTEKCGYYLCSHFYQLTNVFKSCFKNIFNYHTSPVRYSLQSKYLCLQISRKPRIRRCFDSKHTLRFVIPLNQNSIVC